MVSLKLNKYIFFVGETAEAIISDMHWTSKHKLIVIKDGRMLYVFEWTNYFDRETTHKFTIRQDMVGKNTLVLEVFDWEGRLKDYAEVYFTVYSLGGGGGGGFESIWLTLLQYAPYILMFGLPLTLLVVVKRRGK